MKSRRWFPFSFIAIICLLTARETGAQSERPTTLHNGWRLTPAGKLIRLRGDMPLRAAVAPDDKLLLMVTGGFHDHAIDLIDPEEMAVRQSIPLGKAWAGLAVDRARGEIFVSGGGPAPKELRTNVEIAEVAPDVKAAFDRPILGLGWDKGAAKFQRSLSISGLDEKNRFIAGLATDSQGHLFAVNIQTNTLYKLDAGDGHVIGFTEVGRHPFQLAISPDEASVAVGNWGEHSISLLSTSTMKEYARIPVGDHPTDLAFARDGRLFVANASSNSVSTIRDSKVIETIVTSLRPNDPIGSTPNAVVVNADASRLYVANADNNDIAVVDIHEPGHSSILGFIPTGWYPSSLALTHDGKQLVVGVAKGIGPSANWPGQDTRHKPIAQELNSQPFDYITTQMTGFAEVIRVPDAEQLARYTHQVEANLPVADREITASERHDAEAAFRNIKHIIFIIRENHTYDQNLGDDPRGDGRKELAFCGERMTPNLHALVHQTPLLDRFFVNGEVSEDGHYWANSAYSTAFNERQTASMYGQRGAPGPDDPDEAQDLLHSPAGYLWEVAKRAGLSYFSYGEFGEKPSQALMVTDDKDIHGHISTDWGYLFDKRDSDRAKIFVRDLKVAEHTGRWPAYTVMSLPWDHTMGMAPGKPAPQAMVADNDLALGLIVDALSHSSLWASTAIFVTEDDAQAGPDHVDAHRSVGLVISPYIKTGLVDHTPYTMTSMVRTMELILKLPSMTQHDRDATPMYRLFQAKPVMWTYSAKAETVDLNALNPKTGPLAKASMELDFSGVDRADPEKLNAILWTALNPGVSMPAPVRSSMSLK